MTAIKQYIEAHGFDAFINSDDSVSFYIPVDFTDWVLITVSNLRDARIALGY